MAYSAKYVLSSDLLAEIADGNVLLISPTDGRTKVRLSPDLAKVLMAGPALVGEGLSSAEAEFLVKAGIIVRYGENDLASGSDPSSLPRDWGLVARTFHAQSRSARYITQKEGRQELFDRISLHPAPVPCKQFIEAPRIFLPRDVSLPRVEFEQVLRKRRTLRCFRDLPVALDDLSIALRVAFAPQRFVDGGQFGTIPLRTSPNAGGRNEIEVYVLAMNVEDVAAGVYHYNILEHSLELLDSAPTREHVIDTLWGQTLATQAPLFVTMSVVPERIAYKYGDPRSYRLWMYNAGHIAQTFVLTCTALGLGSFQTAAFNDAQLEALLKIEGPEFVSYVLGCGHASDDQGPHQLRQAPAGDRYLTWQVK